MRIVLDGKARTVRGGAESVRELLRELGISPQEALVRVDGAVRPEGTPIGPRSKITVIRVVFGG